MMSLTKKVVFRRVAILMILVGLLATHENSLHGHLSKDWRPGQKVKESMIPLLAAGVILVQKTELGFWDTPYLGTYLQQGGYSFLGTQLNKGETYAFIGAGNPSANDIDISIEDEFGNMIIEDSKDNATPIVVFTPKTTQRCTIKLKLVDAKAPCFCGMALFRKGGWMVSPETLDMAMNNVLRACENVASQRAAKFLDVPGEWAIFGTFHHENENRGFVDIRLGTGRRAITCGGDSFVQNIDLKVYEDWGDKRTLAEDDDPEAVPLVSCTATSSKRYGIEMKNVKSRGSCLIMTAILDVD